MNTLRKNIEFLIHSSGLSAHAFAQKCGLPQPTVHRIRAGTSVEPRHSTLKAIADTFGTTPDALMQLDLSALPPEEWQPPVQVGSGGGVVQAWSPGEPVPEGSVLVPEYRVSFGAGPGREACYDVVEESEPAVYRRSWFRRTGVSAKHAARFVVSGDSMEPLLFDGDSVLVDTSVNEASQVVDGRVYAIRYDNSLRIKRLFRKLDGTLILRSENPRYVDEEVPPALVDEHIAILGRVRERCGEGGL